MPVIWKSNSQMLWEEVIIVWWNGRETAWGEGEKKKKKEKEKDGDKENNLPVFSSLWWDCEGLGLRAELLCVFKTVYIQ